MFAIGDRVEVLEGNEFSLQKGDKGVVIETFLLPTGTYAHRVNVKGRPNYSNIIVEYNIKLI